MVVAEPCCHHHGSMVLVLGGNKSPGHSRWKNGWSLHRRKQERGCKRVDTGMEVHDKTLNIHPEHSHGLEWSSQCPVLNPIGYLYQDLKIVCSHFNEQKEN